MVSSYQKYKYLKIKCYSPFSLKWKQQDPSKLVGGAYIISTDMDGTKETAEQMQHKTQIN